MLLLYSACLINWLIKLTAYQGDLLFQGLLLFHCFFHCFIFYFVYFCSAACYFFPSCTFELVLTFLVPCIASLSCLFIHNLFVWHRHVALWFLPRVGFAVSHGLWNVTVSPALRLLSRNSSCWWNVLPTCFIRLVYSPGELYCSFVDCLSQWSILSIDESGGGGKIPNYILGSVFPVLSEVLLYRIHAPALTVYVFTSISSWWFIYYLFIYLFLLLSICY